MKSEQEILNKIENMKKRMLIHSKSNEPLSIIVADDLKLRIELLNWILDDNANGEFIDNRQFDYLFEKLKNNESML